MDKTFAACILLVTSVLFTTGCSKKPKEEPPYKFPPGSPFDQSPRFVQSKDVRRIISEDDYDKVASVIKQNRLRRENSYELALALSYGKLNSIRALLDAGCSLSERSHHHVVSGMYSRFGEPGGTALYEIAKEVFEKPLSQEQFDSVFRSMCENERWQALQEWLVVFDNAEPELQAEWRESFSNEWLQRKLVKAAPHVGAWMERLSDTQRAELLHLAAKEGHEFAPILDGGEVDLRELGYWQLEVFDAPFLNERLSELTHDQRIGLWKLDLAEAAKDLEGMSKMVRWLPFLDELGDAPFSETRNSKKTRALEFAAKQDKLHLLRWLLDRDIVSDYRGGRPQASLMLAVHFQDLVRAEEIFAWEVRMQRCDIADRLSRVWADVPVMPGSRPYSPLVRAIQNQDWPMVELFLSNGATLMHVINQGVDMTHPRLVTLAARFDRIPESDPLVLQFIRSIESFDKATRLHLVSLIPPLIERAIQTEDLTTLSMLMAVVWAEHDANFRDEPSQAEDFGACFGRLTGNQNQFVGVFEQAAYSPKLVNLLQLEGVALEPKVLELALANDDLEVLRTVCSDISWLRSNAATLSSYIEDYLHRESKSPAREDDLFAFVQSLEREIRSPLAESISIASEPEQEDSAGWTEISLDELEVSRDE